MRPWLPSIQIIQNISMCIKYLPSYRLFLIQPNRSIQQPATNETELAEEIALQSWYFIFEPQTFQSIYGFYPEFPKDFDEEVFREFAKRTAAMSSEEQSE